MVTFVLVQFEILLLWMSCHVFFLYLLGSIGATIDEK